MVNHLIETGSNDVLVVKKCKDSLDGKERLIPYLPDQVIKLVDLQKGIIEVDWDPDF
jgi:16S rRNA processing protein RimM